MYKLLICSLLSFMPIIASDFEMALHGSDHHTLKRFDDHYSIIDNGREVSVKNYYIDPLLRKLTAPSLEKVVKNGTLYVDVIQFDKDNYKLTAKQRMQGGGPIFAGVVYWGVKGICYGVLLGGIIHCIKSGKGAPTQITDSAQIYDLKPATELVTKYALPSLGPLVQVATNVGMDTADMVLNTELGREIGKASVGAASITIGQGLAKTGSVPKAVAPISAGIEFLALSLSTLALGTPLP